MEARTILCSLRPRPLSLRRWRIHLPFIHCSNLHQQRWEHNNNNNINNNNNNNALHTPEICGISNSSSDNINKPNLTTSATTTTSKITESTSTSGSLDIPAWQQIVESIQEVVTAKGDDINTWRRFCSLWRIHFPVAEVNELFVLLEEEMLTFNASSNSSGGRIPYDLYTLPVFLQALCALVQLGETQLSLIFSDSHPTRQNIDISDKTLITTVISELRVVIFYLAQERLVYTLHAAHYHPYHYDHHNDTSEKSTELNINDCVEKEIMRDESPFPNRADERVRHLGVRLTPKELEEAIRLADAASALLTINPPVKLMSVLYRLLLPALGACEQLDSYRLAALATALAKCADYSDPNDYTNHSDINNNNNNNNNLSTNNDNNNNNEKNLRSTAISYTVCSHMHALARALEVRMHESMQHVQDSEAKRRQAQLRLLSLKERKELEKKEKEEEQKKKKKNKIQRQDGENVDEATILLEHVASVCSALAALRYADKRFWNVVIEYTLTSLQRSSSSYSFLLQDIRDILFALDHVHQNNGYDRIMSLLVSLHFLEEAIPPPSAVRKAMKVVKGQTASNFEEK